MPFDQIAEERKSIAGKARSYGNQSLRISSPNALAMDSHGTYL